MKQKNKLILVTAGLLLIFFAVRGYPFEYRVGAEVFEGLFWEDNYLDESGGTFDYDETYNILGLYPECYIDFGGSITGYALGELEWFHSWDAEDENDLDSRLANVFLNYSGSGFSATAGRQLFEVGKGVVLYSDEPGIAISYDGWENFYFKGDMYRVFDRSPMAKMAFGYVPGFLESVEFVGAWYRDRDDRIGELFESLDEDADLDSSGNLFWVGGQGDFFVYDMFVSFLVMHQFGSVEIEEAVLDTHLDVSAYLIDLELNYNVSGELSTAAFVFTASGDRSPESGSLNAFLSPMPFNRRTVIFFNGGFERYDIDEEIQLGGVTWDGVIAPGIKIEYQPDAKIITELVVALLFPEGDLFDTAAWYGWETDTRLSYEFYPGQRIFVEAAVFSHGNFFKQKYGFRPDPATRLVAGIDLIF